ncbi:uncharacterized protein N7496_003804 [Penicillium cataractarum]|uniref:Siderophore biosynthesis n=1 Tax=Penicillium cataractarum TaxID=2100454 RepID=A0A9W9SMS0_9EURO|nr:uncharacterized protein N7496_003804 [Penicillium cataractarum]KAJ5381376.1 hypothetical protein N7496_003804 [Penicillium cataractarum]
MLLKSMLTTALPLLMLAGNALAVGCSTHSFTTCEDKIVHWYDPDTGEVCDPLDCGGGRAPLKTDEPGCPGYTGTKVRTTSYLSCFTPSSALATATTSKSAAAESTTASDSTSKETSVASSTTAGSATGTGASGSGTTPATTAAATLSSSAQSSAAANGTASSSGSAAPTATTNAGDALTGSLMAVAGAAIGAFALL